jgi:hypothetical protein
MFKSPAEKSIIKKAEEANKQQEQQETTKENKEGQPAIKATISKETAQSMEQNKDKTIKEVV